MITMQAESYLGNQLKALVGTAATRLDAVGDDVEFAAEVLAAKLGACYPAAEGEGRLFRL